MHWFTPASVTVTSTFQPPSIREFFIKKEPALYLR
jgi:hypothetical protein